MSIGYLLGWASAKTLKTQVNIPLLLTLSVIPDIDLLFIHFVEHRGPIHSIISTIVVFAPFFALYRKKAIPYFIATVQHSLIGDYIGGGRIQLLWPLTSRYYGISQSITGTVNISIEWLAFLIAIIVMIRTKDITTFFHTDPVNLILAVPTFTVLLPTMLGIPLSVPASLIPPHLVFIILFLAAIASALFSPAGKAAKTGSSCTQGEP